MKSHGLEGSSSCPIAWMDDLYELSMEADKVQSSGKIRFFLKNKVASSDMMPSFGSRETNDME